MTWRVSPFAVCFVLAFLNACKHWRSIPYRTPIPVGGGVTFFIDVNCDPAYPTGSLEVNDGSGYPIYHIPPWTGTRTSPWGYGIQRVYLDAQWLVVGYPRTDTGVVMWEAVDRATGRIIVEADWPSDLSVATLRQNVLKAVPILEFQKAWDAAH